MKTPRRRIAGKIADQTRKHGTSKRFSEEIAAYLLSEHRVNELDSVLRDVQELWARDGYVEVLAATAHTLSAETKANIIGQVRELQPQASSIVITEVLDPTVVGGVQLKFANQQLDLSVEAKLNKFKQVAGVGKE